MINAPIRLTQGALGHAGDAGDLGERLGLVKEVAGEEEAGAGDGVRIATGQEAVLGRARDDALRRRLDVRRQREAGAQADDDVERGMLDRRSVVRPARAAARRRRAAARDVKRPLDDLEAVGDVLLGRTGQLGDLLERPTDALRATGDEDARGVDGARRLAPTEPLVVDALEELLGHVGDGARQADLVAHGVDVPERAAEVALGHAGRVLAGDAELGALQVFRQARVAVLERDGRLELLGLAGEVIDRRADTAWVVTALVVGKGAPFTSTRIL